MMIIGRSIGSAVIKKGVFRHLFIDYFAALAYQIGNGTIKARLSVFLTVPRICAKVSQNKIFLILFSVTKKD